MWVSATVKKIRINVTEEMKIIISPMRKIGAMILSMKKLSKNTKKDATKVKDKLASS